MKLRNLKKRKDYVFACTCKKTKPKPNPKSVIPKQQAAVVTISPIIFLQKDFIIFIFL
jgi:hypothetical protein